MSAPFCKAPPYLRRVLSLPALVPFGLDCLVPLAVSTALRAVPFVLSVCFVFALVRREPAC